MDNKKRKLDENGDAEITGAHVRKLIEPLSKEELMDIVQKAATSHVDVLDYVRKLADKDPACRKLFVRGLSWETSSEALKKAFSQHGEVEEALVVMDKSTGKNKGYGFVTYLHLDGALRALKEPNKKIDGRITVCHLAAAGPPTQQAMQDHAARKIFVGAVPLDFDAEKLLDIFSKYGEIEEGPLGLDKTTKKSKGYALFIYKTLDGANRALEEPVKTVDGHQLHCKLAADNQKQKVDGFPQAQSDIDLALLHAGNSMGAASTAYLNALGGAHSLSSVFHPGLSSINPSIVQQLGLGPSLGHSSLHSSLNLSLPSSYNASLAYDGSHSLSHLGHLPSAATLGACGLGSYASALGLSETPYPSALAASLYGVPVASETSVQGSGSHLSSLQASELARAAGSRLQSLSSYYSI